VPDVVGPPGAGGAPARAPGWREVLLVAALVLAAVFGVEVLSALVPPLGDLFRSFPTTIAILVAGTVGLLVLIAIRRPRA